MPATCAVVNCNSSSYKPQASAKISFHSFPKDKKISNIWVEKIGRAGGKINVKNARVCSLHFPPSAFEVTMQQRLLNYSPRLKSLKAGILPSLLLPKGPIEKKTTRTRNREIKKTDDAMEISTSEENVDDLASSVNESSAESVDEVKNEDPALKSAASSSKTTSDNSVNFWKKKYDEIFGEKNRESRRYIDEIKDLNVKLETEMKKSNPNYTIGKKDVYAELESWKKRYDELLLEKITEVYTWKKKCEELTKSKSSETVTVETKLMKDLEDKEKELKKVKIDLSNKSEELSYWINKYKADCVEDQSLFLVPISVCNMLENENFK